MKKPNYKLVKYILEMIGLLAVLLVIIVISIIFIYNVINGANPLLLHNKTFIIISTSVLIILLGIAIFYLIKIHLYTKRIRTYSSMKKIYYSLLFLFASLSFLLSVQYLYYINDSKYFNIGSEFYNHETAGEIYDIEEEIRYNQSYKTKYTELISQIDTSRRYKIIKLKRNNFVIISKDTMRLRLRFTPDMGIGTSARTINDPREIAGINIGFPTENYITSRFVYDLGLDTHQLRDSLSSKYLRILTADKIDYFSDRKEDAKKTLNIKKQIGLSFGSYILYNLSKGGNIAHDKTHLMVRLILLLQITILTFIVGYICKHGYKVLDGE